MQNHWHPAFLYALEVSAFLGIILYGKDTDLIFFIFGTNLQAEIPSVDMQLFNFTIVNEFPI